jgi:3-oxoacyl-[acyl-carrier protein] reductase
MTSLTGRVAIVTGSSKGLGAGIVRRLARDGATAIGFDIIPEEVGSATAGSPEQLPVRRHYTVDVRDAAAVESAVTEVWTHHGRLDVMICNAAVMQRRASVIDVDDATVKDVLEVNFMGVLNCCRSAGRLMKAAGQGRIITVASQVAVVPWPGIGVYAASKAAVISLTKTLAVELVPYNVIVNCILPGTMETDQMRQTMGEESQVTGVDLNQLIESQRQKMPLGRMGSPDDAASLAAWLASDEASFSVGGVFDLTGGELLMRR